MHRDEKRKSFLSWVKTHSEPYCKKVIGNEYIYFLCSGPYFQNPFSSLPIQPFSSPQYRCQFTLFLVFTAKWKFIVRAPWHLCSRTFSGVQSAADRSWVLGRVTFPPPSLLGTIHKAPEPQSRCQSLMLCSDIDLLKWGANTEFQAYWNRRFFPFVEKRKSITQVSQMCTSPASPSKNDVLSCQFKGRKNMSTVEALGPQNNNQEFSQRFQTPQISVLLGKLGTR